MDRCDKIAAGVLVVIMMGLMFIFGAMSQTIYNCHTVHKMGLVIIELENKCDEQIEKIAC